MASFIESGYTSKIEYEAAQALGSSSLESIPTLGYWKIRGLAAACRMMLYYKGQKFTNKGYAEDCGAMWFGGDKPRLVPKCAVMNLPYIEDGETVVAQSNTCLLYLGKKLGIDKEALFFTNHMVIDEAMDLRNELMKLVYPFAGKVTDAAQLPEKFTAHMEGAASFSKLEGMCKGPYMCGAAPQSGDFHVFELLDQHVQMSEELKVPHDFAGKYPKLMALRAAFKAEPTLASYYASDMYAKYAINNPMATFFTGAQFDGTFGPTVTELVTP